MKASLIDGSDFDRIDLASAHDESDPLDDKELVAYALENGATHIAIEGGHAYKAINGASYFFKRHGDKIDKIESERDPEGIDSCDFIKLERKGSIYENLDKIREHFLESCTPVVLYGPPARGKALLVNLLCRVDGIKAVKSYGLYGMSELDMTSILREVIETASCFDSDHSVVFSTTNKAVADALKPYMPVFYLDNDYSDVRRHHARGRY